MLSATAPTPRAVVTNEALRWVAWLRHAWWRPGASDDERFLGEACDLADLERRLRRLEQGREDRFGPLTPHP